MARPYEAGTEDTARLVARLTAIASIAAGVIHFSAAGDHANLPIMLAGFLVVGTLQVALGAVLLWRRPSRLLIAAGVALALGAIATWLVSRTAGLPFLEDGHMEPVGVKDGICVLFELATVPGLLLLLHRDLARLSLPPRLRSRALSIAAAATIALVVPAVALEGGSHHTHEEAVELGIHGHGDDPEPHETTEHAGPEEPGEDHGHANRTAKDDHHRGEPDRRDHDVAHGTTQLASFRSHPHSGSATGPSPRTHRSHRERNSDGQRTHSRDHSDRDRDDKPHDHGKGRGRGENHGDHKEPDEPAQPSTCLISVGTTQVCLPD